MMHKKHGHVLLRVTFVALCGTFLISLYFLFCSDLHGTGKIGFVLIAISSFLSCLSLFLNLKSKDRPRK